MIWLSSCAVEQVTLSVYRVSAKIVRLTCVINRDHSLTERNSAMQTNYKIHPLTWWTREQLSSLSFCVVIVLLGMSMSEFSVHSLAEDLVVTISGEEIQFVKIPAGTFVRGSKKTTEERISVRNNGPEHQVTISRPFQMGKYEVTIEQWDAFNGYQPEWAG